MSYIADTVESTLTTTPENLEALINALRTQNALGVSNPETLTRERVLDKYHLEYWTGSDGKIHLSFYYDENFWFDEIEDTLTPYVEGMIGFQGEDGCLFGYRYEDGNLFYTTGKIVWEDK